MFSGNKLVYSAGPQGSATPKQTAASKVVPRPVAAHDLRIRRESSGRGGKQVSVVQPLFMTEAEARSLLKELKRAIGTGGTLREIELACGSAFALELQGDKVEALLEALSSRGFRGKRAGG